MCLSYNHVAKIVLFSKSAYDVRVFLSLIYIFIIVPSVFKTRLQNAYLIRTKKDHRISQSDGHKNSINYKLTAKRLPNMNLTINYLWFVFLNQLRSINDKGRMSTMMTGFAADSTALSHAFSLRSTG